MSETFNSAYTVSRSHTDTSDIPADIRELYRRYAEAQAATSADRRNNTGAQNRTVTLRFNKLCKAINTAGMNVPNVLARLATTLAARNAALENEKTEWRELARGWEEVYTAAAQKRDQLIRALEAFNAVMTEASE